MIPKPPGPGGIIFFGFFEIGCYPMNQADHPLFCLIMTHMVMNHSIGHYEVKIFHKKKLQWVDLFKAQNNLIKVLIPFRIDELFDI